MTSDRTEPPAFVLTIGGRAYDVVPAATEAARDLIACLPMTLDLSRWGDEYYGEIPEPITADADRTAEFEVGDVALWPAGNAFCIFFGPTPASVDERPIMASPGVLLGHIAADVRGLRALGPDVPAELRLR